MKDKKEPTVKSFSFGGCDIAQTSPHITNLNKETPVLNVRVRFEDALKLHLAIGECIRKLNSYKRSTTAGKRTSLNLAIHLGKDRITVNEGLLSIETQNKADGQPHKAPNGGSHRSFPDGRATQDAFNNKPMPKKRAAIPLRLSFTNEEFAQISKGFIPESMDDHWFIYLDASTNKLHMHRSWTGFCIYIVEFDQVSDGWKVASGWVNRNPKQYEITDTSHDVAVASWLIDVLLLGKEQDFPSKS